MANESDATARPASGGRGRHRTPGAPPPWLAMARVVLAVCGVIVALWVGLSFVTNLVRGDQANPSAAPATSDGATTDATGSTGSTGTEAPTGSASSGQTSTPVTPTVPPSSPPSSTGWTPQKAATDLVKAFDAEAAAGSKGALVLAGKFGDNVDNTPVTVIGEWGTGKLRNGLTVAANHEQALRAGKLVARKALPTATTTAKVAVTRTDVRSLPVISARDTFATLTAKGRPDCAECQDIIVTGVAPTKTKVATTLGTVEVPAWSYEVQGTKARIIVPALAPTAMLDPSPPFRGKVPPDVDAGQLPLWRTTLSEDGRVFTGFVDTAEVRKRGGCWQLYAHESDTSVAVYAAAGSGSETSPCASSTGRVTVTLAKPLGGRTLLDTYWTRAIAP